MRRLLRGRSFPSPEKRLGQDDPKELQMPYLIPLRREMDFDRFPGFAA